jgi:hypothetical protein
MSSLLPLLQETKISSSKFLFRYKHKGLYKLLRFLNFNVYECSVFFFFFFVVVCCVVRSNFYFSSIH